MMFSCGYVPIWWHSCSFPVLFLIFPEFMYNTHISGKLFGNFYIDLFWGFMDVFASKTSWSMGIAIFIRFGVCTPVKNEKHRRFCQEYGKLCSIS